MATAKITKSMKYNSIIEILEGLENGVDITPKYEYGSRTVKKGEGIGKVGESGNASGAHLHFEIKKDGTRVAPESYVGY